MKILSRCPNCSTLKSVDRHVHNHMVTCDQCKHTFQASGIVTTRLAEEFVNKLQKAANDPPRSKP